MQRVDNNVYENNRAYLKALAAKALEIYSDLEIGPQDKKCASGVKVKRLFSKATHLEDMRSLNQAIQNSDGSPEKVKALILEAIREEIKKPMTKAQLKKYGDVILLMEDMHASPFHKFINKLNGEPAKHHYSRLLCILLNKTNKVIAANIVHPVTRADFMHDPYVNFKIDVPANYSKLDEVKLSKLEEMKKTSLRMSSKHD